MKTELEKIAVIGAGSWGTALALLLASKGHTVYLWGHRKNHIASLIKDSENRKYLPEELFPANLRPSTRLEETLQGAQTVVMVVPSHTCRQVFTDMLPYLESRVAILSAMKGIEEGSLLTMTEVMRSVLEQSACETEADIGVLSGPSFALEVARKRPTAVTVAFADPASAQRQQQIFNTSYFRVYTSRDVLGVELSGALKNIMAIATGMSDGLGFGLNARAALITRGLAEIKRLGVAMGAEANTFLGLSGVGDLMLTCTGNLSRNRHVGYELGKGKNLKSVQQEMQMVAEGVRTTKSGRALAVQQGIDMPILQHTFRILYENEPCQEAVKKLLNRTLKEE